MCDFLQLDFLCFFASPTQFSCFFFLILLSYFIHFLLSFALRLSCSIVLSYIFHLYLLSSFFPLFILPIQLLHFLFLYLAVPISQFSIYLIFIMPFPWPYIFRSHFLFCFVLLSHCLHFVISSTLFFLLLYISLSLFIFFTLCCSPASLISFPYYIAPHNLFFCLYLFNFLSFNFFSFIFSNFLPFMLSLSLSLTLLNPTSPPLTHVTVKVYHAVL